MNIHEYQAKALLRHYGAPVSDGRVVTKADEAKSAAGELDGPLWVVKAQIHAGGRGKGHFAEAAAGEKGGVRLAKSVAEAEELTRQMGGLGQAVQVLGFQNLPLGQRQPDRDDIARTDPHRLKPGCSTRRIVQHRLPFAATLTDLHKSHRCLSVI